MGECPFGVHVKVVEEAKPEVAVLHEVTLYTLDSTVGHSPATHTIVEGFSCTSSALLRLSASEFSTFVPVKSLSPLRNFYAGRKTRRRQRSGARYNDCTLRGGKCTATFRHEARRGYFGQQSRPQRRHKCDILSKYKTVSLWVVIPM